MYKIFSKILNEAKRAEKKYGRIASGHEIIAVLREEYLELEREIFKKQKKRNIRKIQLESVQIAAICMRIIKEIPYIKR